MNIYSVTPPATDAPPLPPRASTLERSGNSAPVLPKRTKRLNSTSDVEYKLVDIEIDNAMTLKATNGAIQLHQAVPLQRHTPPLIGSMGRPASESASDVSEAQSSSSSASSHHLLD